jgi:hypothetical protein
LIGLILENLIRGTFLNFWEALEKQILKLITFSEKFNKSDLSASNMGKGTSQES